MDEVFPAGWTLADRGPGPDEGMPVWAILADGSIALMASVVVGDDADGDYSAWAKVYSAPWWDEDKGEWRCEPDIDDSYDVRAWLPLPKPPTLAELAAPKANAAPDPALLALARLGARLCRDQLSPTGGFCHARHEHLDRIGIEEGVLMPGHLDSTGPVPKPGIAAAIAALLAPDGADGAGEVAGG